ncbi:MAG TPA: hypothetical protein VNS58_12175 [Puia sp.]|nr:hypothetical protein [Puia sp.]
MKFRKTIRLLLTFYKNFFFFSFLMTLICMGLFREYGMSIFSTLFWLKLSTLGLTIVVIKSYKNKEFYYYQNLGLTRTFLWVSTLGFDFILYLFLLTGIHLLSAPHGIKEPSAAGTSYVVAHPAISLIHNLYP